MADVCGLEAAGAWPQVGLNVHHWTIVQLIIGSYIVVVWLTALAAASAALVAFGRVAF